VVKKNLLLPPLSFPYRGNIVLLSVEFLPPEPDEDQCWVSMFCWFLDFFGEASFTAATWFRRSHPRALRPVEPITREFHLSAFFPQGSIVATCRSKRFLTPPKNFPWVGFLTPRPLSEAVTRFLYLPSPQTFVSLDFPRTFYCTSLLSFVFYLLKSDTARGFPFFTSETLLVSSLTTDPFLYSAAWLSSIFPLSRLRVIRTNNPSADFPFLGYNCLSVYDAGLSCPRSFSDPAGANLNPHAFPP